MPHARGGVPLRWPVRRPAGASLNRWRRCPPTRVFSWGSRVPLARVVRGDWGLKDRGGRAWSAVDVEVFVVVPVVGRMPAPVVQVVQVVIVRDCAVTATVAMDVVVFGFIVRPMRRATHQPILLPVGAAPSDDPGGRRTRFAGERGTDGIGDNDAPSSATEPDRQRGVHRVGVPPRRILGHPSRIPGPFGPGGWVVRPSASAGARTGAGVVVVDASSRRIKWVSRTQGGYSPTTSCQSGGPVAVAEQGFQLGCRSERSCAGNGGAGPIGGRCHVR
jgi:hypothetical protein